ncbi:hypothetical protein E2320_008397 [Naja naja]|nr:hypothetical protein E2320_008397 [Naja naja]
MISRLFHEMAIYDIPAAINFILQKTEQDSLYYIGYSQGASIGFITFGILPYLSDRVKLFIALAPSYTLEGTNGTLGILAKIPHGLREVGNINKKNLNTSRVDVYAAIYPDYSSVKTFTHWIQVIHSTEFKYYDYGYKNMEVYNMRTPPFYKIEDVTVPVAVWSGGKDITVTKKNIESLLAHITDLVFYKDIPGWTHSDSILDINAPRRLYPDVLELMQKYKD